MTQAKALRADAALRAVGVFCAVAAGSSCVAVLTGMLIGSDGLAKWAAFTFLGAVLIPYGVMRCHLVATRTLTDREKSRWNRVTFWGLSALVFSFFYLCRADRRLE